MTMNLPQMPRKLYALSAEKQDRVTAFLAELAALTLSHGIEVASDSEDGDGFILVDNDAHQLMTDVVLTPDGSYAGTAQDQWEDVREHEEEGWQGIYDAMLWDWLVRYDYDANAFAPSGEPARVWPPAEVSESVDMNAAESFMRIMALTDGMPPTGEYPGEAK